MVKARKYVTKRKFQGVPKRDDFEIVEYELPALKDGEFLVKTEFISVDPYLRYMNNHIPVPYDQFGNQIGVVQESKNAGFPVGSRVLSHKGWRDYVILGGKPTGEFLEQTTKLPDLQGLSPSVGIGAVGMPGATAYFGLLEVCQPKAGETVVVSGAAGAVGSLAGQIAKIKGCKVIGLAGTEEKVRWLENDLGFDKAINYKKEDIVKALKEAAPSGIDCYFDNVGGEISSIVMNQMNDFGRVAACGSISVYNEDQSNLPKATIIQPSLVFKQLKLQGFNVYAWGDQWNAAFVDLIRWIKSGQLKTREQVTKGFDNIYDAFVDLLAGGTTGKAVVAVE